MSAGKCPDTVRAKPPPPPSLTSLHLFIYRKYNSVHLTQSTKYSDATPRQISSDFPWLIVIDEVTISYVTFRWPCIVRTVHVSDSSSAHHQESSTVHTATGLWHIPLLCVQWKNCWWWTEELSETCRVLFQKWNFIN